MEKLITSKILNHLQMHNQFGFLGGRSTLLQLLIMVEKWTEALEIRNTQDQELLQSDVNKMDS